MAWTTTMTSNKLTYHLNEEIYFDVWKCVRLVDIGGSNHNNDVTLANMFFILKNNFLRHASGFACIMSS